VETSFEGKINRSLVNHEITPYYRVKRALKLVRWRWRRAAASLRWGAAALQQSPIVFGNAMPKSGSHLISQVLQGLTRLGPSVNPGFPPINRAEDNRNLPPHAILENLRAMRPGDVAYGYLGAEEPYLSELTRRGRATIFLYRDPRDMLVSHVFYATQMRPEHGMHDFYTQDLDSMEARLNAAIQGVDQPGFELRGVRARYEQYLGWLSQPQVLSLRFEDLILDRWKALERLLGYLAERSFKVNLPRPKAIESLAMAVAPGKSGTFRKGQPGNWREHFTPANKACFKAAAGDLLIRLGYEDDHDW